MDKIGTQYRVIRSRTAIHKGIALFLWLASSAIPIDAQQYVEISAVLETKSYPFGDTNSPALNRIHVACIAGTNEWRIENDFVRGAAPKYMFDGTNVYAGLQVGERLDANGSQARRGELRITPFTMSDTNTLAINVFASDDGHPLDDISVNIPWLAFCSGSYLKREGRIVPMPSAILRHALDGFGYSDKTTTFDDEFGLPRTIELFTSKQLYEASVRNFHRSYFVDPELVPRSEYTTPDGLLKFLFTVTESTNFMGWNVPVKFDWVHYDVGRNGQWGPHYAGTGTVTSIRQAGKPEGLLVAGMEQTVVDWRMRHEAKQILSIIYVSTNAFVAPTNDPTLQERLARKAARKWAETTVNECLPEEDY